MLRRSVAITGLSLALCLASSACTPTARTVATIAQPEVTGLPVAPDQQRVDLNMPTFSDSTNITNALFPVSSQQSVLLVGQVDGESFRTEVTLLPETRIIEWNGERIEVVVSQYVAFLDRRLHEVAYDFYAQDDSGAVWYFGEDVFNFRDGAIVDTHGTWIAGKDGHAAMIMPANAQVGDVYRPENIPGFVFEEVTVKAIDQTLAGPLGPVEGGMVVEELHMDGFTENKIFGPAYGEFLTGGGGDVEALALAVPTDATTASMPSELSNLSSGLLDLLATLQATDWAAAAAKLEQIATTWDQVRGNEVPILIEPILITAIEAIGEAVVSRNEIGASNATIDAAMSTFDLQLRYRPPAEVDLARFDLWLAQTQVDARAEDAEAMNGDFFVLDYIRDRVLQAMEPADVTSLNLGLEELLAAVADADFAATESVAEELRSEVGSFQLGA